MFKPRQQAGRQRPQRGTEEASCCCVYVWAQTLFKSSKMVENICGPHARFLVPFLNLGLLNRISPNLFIDSPSIPIVRQFRQRSGPTKGYARARRARKGSEKAPSFEEEAQAPLNGDMGEHSFNLRTAAGCNAGTTSVHLHTYKETKSWTPVNLVPFAAVPFRDSVTEKTVALYRDIHPRLLHLLQAPRSKQIIHTYIYYAE